VALPHNRGAVDPLDLDAIHLELLLDGGEMLLSLAETGLGTPF
jgi:hypothetical protein